jgi:hypothetical protein
MEQHYVFLKNNRVANIAVFASQDEALADAVAHEHGFDDAVWVGTEPLLCGQPMMAQHLLFQLTST